MADHANEPAGSIPEPCVRICCFDERGVCMGCFRKMPEITGWRKSSDDEKREILTRCRLRARQCDDRIE